MITIHPIASGLTVCPSCSSSQTGTKTIHYPGIHIVAEGICHQCGYEYVQDLPVGHACYYPVSIGINDRKIYDPFRFEWFTTAFINAWQHPSAEEIKIERIIRKKSKEIILVNCLDYLYGHVLLKLFNLSFYKEQHPDKSIVVIIPSNFVWLVPAFVEEVWSVHVKLSKMRNCYRSLDKQINHFISEYGTVHLAYTYPHPYTEAIDIASYTGVKKMDLSSFNESPLTVTFIYRTDRLWCRNRLQHLLFLVSRKIGIIKYLRFLFPGIQDRAIRKTEALLRKKYPFLIFRVAGIGKAGNMGKGIQDLRVTIPDTDTEQIWCKSYASSHVVIGMHGSNMLIPSSLAASVVELLPEDRTGNLTQDIITSYTARMALYTTRFISDMSSPAQVVMAVESLYKGLTLFRLYNEQKNHIYTEDKEQNNLNQVRMKILEIFRTNKK